MTGIFVVSACLAGEVCRYDGTSRPCSTVQKLVRQGRALALCPEMLAGLPCPRPTCEKRNGRVVSSSGQDLTEQFTLGAERALAKALASGSRLAILKSRSPSCGLWQIYDGSFQKRLCHGNGLWAALLLEAGFTIYSEENLPEISF